MKFTRDLAVDVADILYRAMYDFPSVVENLVRDVALLYVLDGISFNIDLAYELYGYMILQRPEDTKIDIDFRRDERIFLHCRVVGTDCDFYYPVEEATSSMLRAVILDGILPTVQLQSVEFNTGRVFVSGVIQLLEDVPSNVR